MRRTLVSPDRVSGQLKRNASESPDVNKPLLLQPVGHTARVLWIMDEGSSFSKSTSPPFPVSTEPDSLNIPLSIHFSSCCGILIKVSSPINHEDTSRRLRLQQRPRYFL